MIWSPLIMWTSFYAHLSPHLFHTSSKQSHIEISAQLTLYWAPECTMVALDQFSSVQSLSHVWLFAASWPAAPQASLSITNSWSLLKLMSIESAMPSIISSLGQLHHSYPLQHSFCLWASLSGRVVVLPRILAYWWWEEVVSLSLDSNQETCSLDSNGSHLKAWRRAFLKQCARNLTTHTLNFPFSLGNFFVLLSTMHPTHKTS